MNIKDKIKSLGLNSIGEVIPKPNTKKPFRIKGMGHRRNEEALIYFIPSHTRPSPYQKGITLSEFESAYSQLKISGKLTRQWFNLNLPICAKEGSCNFTTVGGIFELLKLAKYYGKGCYTSLS